MARETTYRCDICKQPTDHIVNKMFLGPAGRTNPTRAPHSEYTHHLDVGVCCWERVLKAFDWKKRMTAAEYQASRKNGKR